MSFKSYIKKVIGPFSSAVFKANHVSLSKDYKLPTDIEMKGAQLKGKISISEGCLIRSGVTIAANSDIKIGRYTSINGPATEIMCNINNITIGSFCSIARQVSIQEFNHRSEGLTTYHIFKNIFNEGVKEDIESKGAIYIGNDVWIGANASILSGVRIGHGAIIGANAVVAQDVPSYAIVGGVPAKILKMRFQSEVIDKLLEVKWWDWNVDKIKKNRFLFEGNLTIEKLKRIK